jgi:hypothetical protein
LVVKVRLPVTEPEAVGLNVTGSCWLPPGVSVNGALALTEKGPVTETVLRVIGLEPVFFTVNAWGALVVPTLCSPKATEVGVSVRAGFTPVPERATTTLAHSGSLLVRVRVPVAVPWATGLKLTEKLWAAFGSSVKGIAGGEETEKGPLIERAVKVMGAVPVLLSVTVRAALGVPTRWSPKASEAGFSVRLGFTPVPVSLTKRKPLSGSVE